MGRGGEALVSGIGSGGALGGVKGAVRVRNKITHKTRLRILHGDVADADRTILDDLDAQDGKALATGVDAEDANEYHLLAVLAASQNQASSSATFCQGQPSSSRKNAFAAPAAPAQPALYIPTPDATGKVSNYTDYYEPIPWEPSTLLTKSSETLEELQGDALGGGYAYVLDERDTDWLERSNKLANGEGSSSSPTRVVRTPKARGGKEPEGTANPVAISEDDFELVMGLFERVTDERAPCLHVTPHDIPPLTEYESFFANSLPLHYFPSYTLPSTVPPPPLLSRYARIIYPHWRERKLERGGRRIIPQLNYDESNDSDPYVCFRRREVKPLRKTRRQDATSLDRLLRLHDEMERVLTLARSVLDRENLKADLARDQRVVTEKRVKLVEVKRKVGAVIPDDDLFVDRDRNTAAMQKRRAEAMAAAHAVQLAKVDGSGTIKLRAPRPGGMHMDGQQMQQGQEGHHHISALIKIQEIQHRVEREVARRKDPGWEDLTESAFQPLPTPLSSKHFRGGLRMRVGRGGRMLVDRRPRSKVEEPESDAMDVDQKWRMEERWRYDCDGGYVVGGTGFVPAEEAEDPRLIVDDFEHKTFLVRRHLILEEDFNTFFRTDEGPLRRAEMAYDARKEQDRTFAQEAAARALVVRREVAARAPPPVVPPPTPTPQPFAANMKKPQQLTPQPQPQQPQQRPTPVLQRLPNGNGVQASPSPMPSPTSTPLPIPPVQIRIGGPPQPPQLTTQQALGLKNVFASVNGTAPNLGGNIPLKLPVQRAMQWAAANGASTKPGSGPQARVPSPNGVMQQVGGPPHLNGY